MKFELIPTPDFEKSFKVLAKRHRSLKQDFLDFSKELKDNPFQGVELTQGIRRDVRSVRPFRTVASQTSDN